jgi:ribonucleoside-diphosphate reductase alpha chain
MVHIDLSRDALLHEFARQTLEERYMMPGETSPQEAFARAAKAFADDDAHAQRIYDYASQLWFMYATPVLSNGGTSRGLPISCYLNYVPDSRDGITDHYTENAWLASMGGGIGGYWGHVRSDGQRTSRGSRSSGTIPFMHVVDAEMLAFSQGQTRRGSYAAYQDAWHPEIEEFLLIRKPTGGDVHRKCLNLHHAVNVDDRFMEAILAGEEYDLIDPYSKDQSAKIDARHLWQKILETRVATGEPYIHFIDSTNRKLPKTQQKLGLKVHQSNLCSEITLPTDENRTAVCCLSSVNLERYDDWKDHPTFIADLVRFLDNVITAFIDQAPDYMHRAKFSAAQERSIGLGAMGFHAYLQSRNIPFESALAVGLNLQMFENIKSRASEATHNLALEKGPCPDALGEPIRNMHLLAIAPNATSSIICGYTSPSIEPYRANAFVQKTLNGSVLFKNKHLENRLSELGQNTDNVWQSIITGNGSVQHLDFLEDWDKQVFKTGLEIDQRWIIDHASTRQEFICQAQSVNVFFPADVDVKTLHDVHFRAWKKGLKTLYYCHSEAIRRAEIISKKVETTAGQPVQQQIGLSSPRPAKSAMSAADEVECLACEG